jgi:hypothetical protein
MLKTLTEKEVELSAALRDAAASISARLGHRPGP